MKNINKLNMANNNSFLNITILAHIDSSYGFITIIRLLQKFISLNLQKLYQLDRRSIKLQLINHIALYIAVN